MEINNFISLVSIIIDQNVGLKKNVYGATKKWYDTTLEDVKELDVETDYTVFFGDTQEYTFKTGKNEDTFVKSFISQYLAKAVIYNIGITEDVRPLTKEEKRVLIINNVNNPGNLDRIVRYGYYATLYGIGMLVFFMSYDTFNKSQNIMNEYLRSKGISYSNQTSEAGWVYRWVINSDKSHHNLLLNEM